MPGAGRHHVKVTLLHYLCQHQSSKHRIVYILYIICLQRHRSVRIVKELEDIQGEMVSGTV